MTEISREHVEWVFVDRLCQMLEAPPSDSYEVSETYALFTTILCWVMQHIRIPEDRIRNDEDNAARQLFKTLEDISITADPWNVPVVGRVEIDEGASPANGPARGFETHTVARLLKNLRDAVAHGDARTIEPINRNGRLIGFRFKCAEKQDRRTVWRDHITLRQQDMRRIGVELARRYCDAVQHGATRWSKDAFEADAASIQEKAA